MNMGNVLPLRRGRELETSSFSDLKAYKESNYHPSPDKSQDGSCHGEQHDPNAKPEPKAQPTAKEAAMARAARIRLGYEKVDTPTVAPAALPGGPEPAQVDDVDYVPPEGTTPLSDPVSDAEVARAGLQSGKWVEACRALKLIQRLAVHHAAVIQPHLSEIVPLMLNHVRSPRSQLCKVAILCFGDVLTACAAGMGPLVDGGASARPADSALYQLLVKSTSSDKKFCVDAASKVLQQMAAQLEATAFIAVLLPYTQHKSPKVRGATAACLSQSLEAMRRVRDAAAVVEYCRGGLLRSAAAMLTDNTPEARAGSRRCIELIQECVEAAAADEGKNVDVPAEAASEDAGAVGDDGVAAQPVSAWEAFCGAHLSPTDAYMVRKLTTVRVLEPV